MMLGNGCPPWALTLPLNLQGFGTSRWQLPAQFYNDCRLQGNTETGTATSGSGHLRRDANLLVCPQLAKADVAVTE
jgi:hypothetical protein